MNTYITWQNHAQIYVNTFLCLQMRARMHVWVCVSVWVRAHVYTHASVCMRVIVHTQACVCVCARARACACMCVCVCVCVCDMHLPMWSCALVCAYVRLCVLCTCNICMTCVWHAGFTKHESATLHCCHTSTRAASLSRRYSLRVATMHTIIVADPAMLCSGHDRAHVCTHMHIHVDITYN